MFVRVCLKKRMRLEFCLKYAKRHDFFAGMVGETVSDELKQFNFTDEGEFWFLLYRCYFRV